MQPLEIRLLGPPDVQYGGNSLHFSTRKTLALLVYLALERGMQPREKLAALFWPESDTSRARANLRSTLNYLRSALAQHGVGKTPHLLIERNTLGFNFESDYSLDLDVVRQATDSEELGALQDALRQARGEFLEGFSLSDAPAFDDWATVQRELWHRRMEMLFDNLSRLQFERGQINDVQETLLGWLEHNPLNEVAYRHLIRAQIAAGERNAALQTFERCREMLEAELGVAPTPETQELASQLEISQPAVAGKQGTRRGGRQPATNDLKFADGPMVGRETEFTALVTRYHHAAHGQPQIAVILGEAGIGKTRLASEFLSWAAARGADVLQGRSFESGRRLPYQPLLEALRPRLERVNAPEDLLSDTWLLELSRLLPELLDRYPDLLQLEGSRPQLEEAAARTHLFEAVTRLIAGLSEQLPQQASVVLFVDDLQWTDAATLDLLQYACRRWQELRSPVLLLATMRSEMLHPLSVTHTPHLAGWLSGLQKQSNVTSLQLEPLSDQNTEQFISAFTAGNNAPPLADWLFEETRGQPFYLIETLEDLREAGILQIARDADECWYLEVNTDQLRERYRSGRAANVPEKVRQVIVQRISRLSPAAFDMLAAGAVLAQDFTFELLCSVADLGVGEGLRALDEVLGSQLLREYEGGSHPGGAPYIFGHDKIRDVAYTEAGDARRRVFHRRALPALEATGAPAARLVHHALAASDQEAALHHSMAAGDEALHLYATQEAITHYEQARALLNTKRPVARDPSGALESQSLQHLYLQLGRAQELCGDYEEALAVYDELQQLARDRDDKPLELAALMARTTVYAAPTQYYDPQSVAVLTQQALPLARELGDHAAEARILWNLMLLNLFTGNAPRAVRDGEASLAIAREHNLREAQAYAHHDLTRAYLFVGQTEKGASSAQNAESLWRALDNKAMLADILSTSASFLVMGGQTDEAMQRLQEALILSRHIGNLWNQSYAQHHICLIYFDWGHFSQTIKAVEEAVALGKQAGFMIPAIEDVTVLSVLYTTLGRPERALREAQHALANARTYSLPAAGALAACAYAHLSLGERAQARARLEEARAASSSDMVSGAFFILPWIEAAVLIEEGAHDEAVDVADEFIARMHRRGLRFFLADGIYHKGMALLQKDAHAAAQETLLEARKVAETMGSRRILWQILAALAELAQAQGKHERAAALRAEAADVVQYIAAHIAENDLRESFLNRVRLS